MGHGWSCATSRRADARPSPALDNLLATGLVRENEGAYAVTPAGKAALAATKATKLERIGWPVVWACLAIVALASVIELLT